MTTTRYPRFLGVDGSGDFVWELENGRWTWGQSPNEAWAQGQIRSLEPERYIDKYGRPIGMHEDIDRKAESLEDPAELVKAYQPEPAATDKVAVLLALHTMLGVVESWVQGARENHEGLGHRDPGCCSTFHPDDIRNMINDAARELGIDEPWKKDEAR